MLYFHAGVSALVTTMLVVAIARVLLSVMMAEPKNYCPTLCVGAGFVLGLYGVGASFAASELAMTIARLAGGTAALIVAAAGFFYRMTRTKPA